MANILLTEKCVRSCPYCFAAKQMHDSAPDDVMSWNDLIYVVDFLADGGDRAVSLLGGEPFLHPRIVDIILYIIERGMHVTVFTSGIVADRQVFDDAVELLADVDPRDLAFVVNYNNPSIMSEREREATDRFFRAFARFTTIGVNVYKVPFDYSFIGQTVLRYGLGRSVRLGVAHPVPGHGGVSVGADKMKAMAADLDANLPRLEAAGIVVGMDCGFPLCAFSDEQLGRLYRHTRGGANFKCTPAIDIGPDMRVWPCFPTAEYRTRSLFDYENLDALLEDFDSFERSVRIEKGGLYQECDGCRHRLSGLCSGGCMAHPLNEFINEPRLRYDDVYRDKEG